jgi:ketosteroid isomerase-like protein
VVQQNVEIVRDIIEAWNDRDFEAVLSRMGPDVEVRLGVPHPDDDTGYFSRDGLRDWILNLIDSWAAVTIERVTSLELSDDRLLTIDRWHFEGRDGIEVVHEIPNAWSFAEGLVARIDGFPDRPTAAQALGLRL